jgi:hypothetical protein
VGEPYRLQVIATNAVGDSVASAASDPYTVDYLPAAPDVTAVPADADVAPAGGAVTVSWPAVKDPSPGTAITGYSVEFNGETRNVGRSTTSTTFTGLPTATEFTVKVYARNGAQVSSNDDWVRSTEKKVTTVGLPTAPAQSPSAVSGANGAITVTWGEFGSNGGGTVTYGVRRTVTGSPAPTSCSPSDATGLTSGWTDSGLNDGTSYTYYVFASNGRYCTVASTGAAESKSPPSNTSGTALLAAHDGQFDIQAGSLTSGGIAARYEFSINGGGWAAVSNGQWLTSAANTAVYGTAQTVSYRACRDASADYCGEPFTAPAVTPLNARAEILSCTPPSGGSDGSVVLRDPSAGGSQNITYQASFNRPQAIGLPNWEPYGEYTNGGPVPSATTGVRIKTTATAGGNSWEDPVVLEATCP